MTSEEIKSSVRLSDLVREYGLKVDRKGFVCCPFHKEKTASMKIYNKSNSFHCFGCGSSGDVIKFVQMIENCDFKTAFIRLGGTYEHTTENAKLVANTQREQAKKKRELKEKADAEIKNELSYIIELLKEGCKSLEPFSDEWCFCQNNLPILFEYWEEMGKGKEINQINVYRKCRQIRCYFGVGR